MAATTTDEQAPSHVCYNARQLSDTAVTLSRETRPHATTLTHDTTRSPRE